MRRPATTMSSTAWRDAPPPAVERTSKSAGPGANAASTAASNTSVTRSPSASARTRRGAPDGATHGVQTAPAAPAVPHPGTAPAPAAAGQSASRASVPAQPRPSSAAAPGAAPNGSPRTACSAGPYPACRHATSASSSDQASTHTARHCPSRYISTRPSQATSPPVSARSPSAGMEAGAVTATVNGKSSS